MNKKLLSSIISLSLALCTFYGCSEDADNSSKIIEVQEVTEDVAEAEQVPTTTIIVEATEAEATTTKAVEMDRKPRKTDVENVFEFNDIRYRINSNMVDITEIVNMSGPAYSYGSGSDIVFMFPAWFDKHNMSTQTKLDWRNKVVFHKYTNKTTEIIVDEEYDIAVFSSDIPEVEGEKPTKSTDFIISRRNHPLDNLSISVTYVKGTDEQLIRNLGLEMLRSIEYIGNEQTEPIVTSFECEYFSYEIPEEFSEKIIFKENEKNKNVVSLNYAYAENLSQHLANLHINAISDSAFDTAEEYLKDEYDKIVDHDKVTIIKEPYKTELLGYDVWAMEYSKEYPGAFGTHKCTQYILEKDGVIYDIALANNDWDGHEQVQADFEKLIDCIKIK